ncbi:MAG: hypothetical protein AAB554_05080 [Patescibacteria group bacterium]
MIRVPKKSLFLCGWDDTYAPEMGPEVCAHHVADESGRVFLNNPPFIRFEGEDVLVYDGEAIRFEEQMANNECCSLIDFRRHEIPLIEDGALIFLPMGEERLPVAVLAALKIPYQDVQRLKPESVVRIAYVPRPEADEIILRLAAYFYLHGWTLMDSDPVGGSDMLIRALRGTWPQVMLSIVHYCLSRGPYEDLLHAEDHFRRLAEEFLNQPASAASMRAAAEVLAKAEREDVRNRATTEKIVSDVMRYHESGALYAPMKTVSIEEACLSLRSFIERSG